MPAADATRPWRAIKEGLLLRVRVTPESSRQAIDGVHDTAEGPALKAYVRAVPEDGAANRALEALVADWLGVPRSSVTVSGGARSRVKSVTIAGDGRALSWALAARTVALKR